MVSVRITLKIMECYENCSGKLEDVEIIMLFKYYYYIYNYYFIFFVIIIYIIIILYLARLSGSCV